MSPIDGSSYSDHQQRRPTERSGIRVRRFGQIGTGHRRQRSSRTAMDARVLLRRQWQPTIRFADGSWQNGFGDVKAAHSNDPGTFVNVDCGGVGRELHVCGIINNGKVWHTFRFAVGSWQRYQYDAAGRLAKVTDDRGTSLEKYVYGAGRQRLMTRRDEVSTYYIWSGDVVIAEYVKKRTETRLGWAKSYVHLGGRLLSTLKPKESGEVVQYHHPDRLGTRLVTTKASNAVIEQVTLPFGVELKAESTKEVTNRRFTTYERSATTGLDYAVNRFYDPQQGRFMQADPLEVEGITIGSPQSHNLYSYVQNDPVNSIDPLGLQNCTAYGPEWICIPVPGGEGKLECFPTPGDPIVVCNEGGGGFSGGWGPTIQGPGGEYGGDGGGAGGGGGASGGRRVVDSSDRGLRLSREVLSGLGFTGDNLPRTTPPPTTQLDYLFGSYLAGTLLLLTGGMLATAGGTTLTDLSGGIATGSRTILVDTITGRIYVGASQQVLHLQVYEVAGIGRFYGVVGAMGRFTAGRLVGFELATGTFGGTTAELLLARELLRSLGR
jgi:RHS repeat-associated protein